MFALLIAVTLLNVLIAAGFSIAGVFFPRFIVRDGETSHTARVMAYYAVARAVPLLLVVLWAAFRADAPALLWLGLLAGIIQIADALVGLKAGRQMTIWGPLGLGILQLTVVLMAYWFA